MLKYNIQLLIRLFSRDLQFNYYSGSTRLNNLGVIPQILPLEADDIYSFIKQFVSEN